MSGLNEARLARAEAKAASIDAAGPGSELGPARRPADIVEFVLGKTWLHRPGIYPRQLTLLKILTLALHLLTEFDRRVIAEWGAGFTRDEKDGGSWTGTWGTTPDLIRRAERCLETGRLWFRHPVLVIGRRGGKGHVGALVMAYVLWWYITLEDPHGFFGIAKEKMLAVFIFAANHMQAEANQTADLIGIIESAPCFRPYIAASYKGRLLLWSHQQLQQGETDPKKAAFEISARQATPTAGRGPAAIIIAFDEAAWMQPTGSSRSAQEVEDAALPALGQCRPYEFVFSASSPWSQLGRFYENHVRALKVDPATGEPVHFDMCTLQLTSWDMYQDWELTGPDGLEVAPGRGTFPPLKRPIETYDEDLAREEQENPDSFNVERRGQWAAAPHAYLQADKVRAMFGKVNGDFLRMQTHATHRFIYFGHLDPSVTGANTAIAIGHIECPDPDGPNHIYFDLLHVWRPQDFPNGRIDYLVVEREIGALIEAFRLRELTVDQFGAGSLLDHLQDHARTLLFSPKPNVHQVTETRLSNWARAEEFKRILNEGRVHAPPHEQAELELIFLQQDGTKVAAPTIGPVQNDDLADAIMTVTVRLDSQIRTPHRKLHESRGRYVYANEHAGAFSRAGNATARRPMNGTVRQNSRAGRRRGPNNPAR